MAQLSGKRARFTAESCVVLVVTEAGLHDQGALGQERVVRAAHRDEDTFHSDGVLFERFRVFVPCETLVRSGVRRQGTEHVQRVVVVNVDPIRWFHDSAVLEPIHRWLWVTVHLAAYGDVAVRGKLIAVW